MLDAVAARDGGFTLAVDHYGRGSDRYRRHGAMMPPDGLAWLRTADGISFGAVGGRDQPAAASSGSSPMPSSRRGRGPEGTSPWSRNPTRSGTAWCSGTRWPRWSPSRYPDVTWEKELVDAMAARMVRPPASIDTVVATSLHADILSDLAAALAGSMGIAPTGNIDPERRGPSMFERR